MFHGGEQPRYNPYLSDSPGFYPEWFRRQCLISLSESPDHPPFSALSLQSPAQAERGSSMPSPPPSGREGPLWYPGITAPSSSSFGITERARGGRRVLPTLHEYTGKHPPTKPGPICLQLYIHSKLYFALQTHPAASRSIFLSAFRTPGSWLCDSLREEIREE